MLIIDAHLSPHLAPWNIKTFALSAFSVAYLVLRDANDQQIFDFAKYNNAIVVTKNEDFIQFHIIILFS